MQNTRSGDSQDIYVQASSPLEEDLTLLISEMLVGAVRSNMNKFLMDALERNIIN